MGNVTLESVTENGTISLRYNDLPIILNPGERWENIAHENKIMERADPKSNNNKQNNNLLLNNNGSMVIEEAPWPGCTNEITTAEIIYNAGVFDKKSITIQRR